MVFLDKDILTDMPVHAAMVYVAIRCMMRNEQTEDYYTAGRICHALRLSFDRYWNDQTKFGILYMMNMNLLMPIAHDDFSHGHVFDISKLQLNIKNRYYIKVPEEDLYLIAQSDMSNSKKMALMKYYLMVLGTFNHSKELGEYTGKVGCMPISHLAQLTGVSERTAQRYNECLEQLGLLYIHRSADFIKTSTGLSQITNVYSKAEDKQLCIEYAKEFEGRSGYNNKTLKSYKTKGQADRNRALAQMYLQMTKGKKYDSDTTEEIRQYIENKNKKVQQELEFFIEEGASEELIQMLQSKIRDVSVFKQEVKEGIA